MSDRRTTVDLLLSVCVLLRDGEHTIHGLAKLTGSRRHVVAAYIDALTAFGLIEEASVKRTADRAVISYRWKKVR